MFKQELISEQVLKIIFIFQVSFCGFKKKTAEQISMVPGSQFFLATPKAQF